MLKKRVLKSGAGVVIVKLLSAFLAFVLSVILARFLGAEGYGAYSFVISMLMLLSIPVQAGLPNLAVRETSKALVSDDWPIIGRIWLRVLRLNFVYFSFLIIILLLFNYFSDDWINTRRYELFLAGFILVPIASLTLGQSAIIRGLGKVVVGSAFDGLVRFTMMLALIGLSVLVIPDYELKPYHMIVIYVISISIAYLASLAFLLRQVKGRIQGEIKLHLDSASWRSSLYPLTVIGGIQILFGYADVFILGMFENDKELGVYRVAVQISSLVVFGLAALNQMLLPNFSRLYTENKMEELQKLVTFSSRIILFLSIIPSAILLVFGELIITYVFGQEYSAGTLALSILIVGNLLNAAFGSVGALLNMTGHEKDSMRGMLIALAVNMVLNLILIPIYGMEGAAVATAISMVVWNVILRRYVKLRLGIESAGFLQAKSAV